jgi:predicted  nucleic acid-binding Zn-ribbon protein
MAVQSWTDERLDDLATSLLPLPVKVAALAEAVEHLHEETRTLREDVTGETRALRDELAAAQRQLVQLAGGLVATLIGAVVAVIAAIL